MAIALRDKEVMCNGLSGNQRLCVTSLQERCHPYGQRIGRDQYKIDNLEWSWLTAEQWSKILSILDNFFVNVTFIDPVSNAPKTIKMYCGNRTAEPYWVDEDGHPTHYRNCKVNLIDVGE